MITLHRRQGKAVTVLRTLVTEKTGVCRTDGEIAILTLVVLGKRDNAAVCLRIRESRAGHTVHKGTRLTL